MTSVPLVARRVLFAQANSPLHQFASRLPIQLAPFLHTHQIPALALPILGTTFSNLGSLISTLWDSVLKAVPKKKTTYSRKRSRQLAGKALKDVENVVPCHSCGRPKRPHFLCEHCVLLVKQMWTGKLDEFKISQEPNPDLKTLPARDATAKTSKSSTKPKAK